MVSSYEVIPVDKKILREVALPEIQG